MVYNSGGYERTETIREFSDCIDIWLPDLKYYDSSLSEKYSATQNYFSMASKAIKEMIRVSGGLAWDPENPGLLKKGVVIRHMVKGGLHPAPSLDKGRAASRTVPFKYTEPVYAVL